MRLLDRRRALMTVKIGSTPILPSEYQQVEWISRSDAASDNGYIDTGFIPTPQSSMYARFAAVGTQQTTNFLGSRDGTTGANNAFLIVSFSSARKIGYMRWGSSVQCIAYDTIFHDFELTPTTAKIDGTSYALAAPITTQSSSKTIYFFRELAGSETRKTNNIKLSRCIFGDNGVIMHDFIPCYRKQDGKIGVYDITTNTFIAVLGNGANPQKGPDIN